MKDGYHHGDLPTALVNAGIELINEQGVAALSLRKVAARCGVSHTAPYSHFKDKEQLLDAMKQHVAKQFYSTLAVAKEKANGGDTNGSAAECLQRQVREMGVAYVRFFHSNPAYFTFLFAQPDMQVNLNDMAYSGSYPPFEIFKQAATALLREKGLPPVKQMPLVVGMWAQVHGIAAMSIMPAVQFAGSWEQLTLQILSE